MCVLESREEGQNQLSPAAAHASFDTAQQSSFWTAMASGLSSNRERIWPDPRIKAWTLGNTPLLSLLHGRQKVPMSWTKITHKISPPSPRGKEGVTPWVLTNAHSQEASCRPETNKYLWPHPLGVDEHGWVAVPTPCWWQPW